MNKKIISISDYNEYNYEDFCDKLQNLHTSHHRLITNCYLSNEELKSQFNCVKYMEYHPENCLIWYISENDYLRMYYYAVDEKNLLFDQLPIQTCVCSYVSFVKKNNDMIETVLYDKGFSSHAVWNKWLVKKEDIFYNYHNDVVSGICDLYDQRLCSILNLNFDSYSQRLPNENEFLSFMKDRGSLIIYEDDKIVGFLIYRLKEFLEIEYIYVSPLFRGKKIGKALFSELFIRYGNDINRCIAWIREDNYTSEHLHSKFGFKKTNIQHRVYVKEKV